MYKFYCYRACQRVRYSTTGWARITIRVSSCWDFEELKGKEMLHVLYIISNISCPRKRIKKSGNVMQPLMGPYVYDVNRSSENFLLLPELLFAWGRCSRSRYKCVKIHVVLGCVFNFMLCSKVIYTGLGPELQCLLKVKIDLNWRTYLSFTKSALQSFFLS